MKFLGGVVCVFMVVKVIYKGNFVEFVRLVKIFGCIINKIFVDNGFCVLLIKFVDDILSVFVLKIVYYFFIIGCIIVKFFCSDVCFVDGFFY